MTRTEYCPGNGTRYDLIYGHTDSGDFVLVWLHKSGTGGSAFVFDPGDFPFLHWTYFMEKTGLHKADAAALLSFLSEHTGVEVGMPEGFDDGGLWEGPRDD